MAGAAVLLIASAFDPPDAPTHNALAVVFSAGAPANASLSAYRTPAPLPRRLHA